MGTVGNDDPSSPTRNKPECTAVEAEPPTAPSEASMNGAPALAYPDFAAALKDALPDSHSAELLARNPLLRSGIGNLDGSAEPLDLKALLSQTVSTLFGN